MRSKYPFEKISKHADVYSGYAFKSADLNQSLGIPVIKIKNVNHGTVDVNETQFFPEELVDSKHDKFFLNNGDVLIAMTGQGSVGRIGRIRIPDNCKVLLNQRVGNFVTKESLDLAYFYYVASTTYYEEIFFNAGLGSGQPNLSPSNIGNIEIPIPPLRLQKSIAHILGTLDDKIEVNRQMNETLEGIAQAMFKRWFVDFDPVIDNALAAGNEIPEPLQKRAAARQVLGDQRQPLPSDIQSLFPDRFIFTDEMGWVPEGWTPSTVGEEFNVTMGQSPPGDTYNEDGLGVPFFQGRADFGFRYPSNRVYCTAPKRGAKKGDTLVSVRAPVGDANIASQDCAIGRGVAALRHKTGSRSYTYYSMLQLSEHFKVYEGEGTVFGSINQKDFRALPKLHIPEKVLDTFHHIANELDSKVENNSDQIIKLSKLRDTLLPKLLSGQLRIAKAEKQVVEAV